MFTPSQRNYTQQNNGQSYRMYCHSENHSMKLVNENTGNEVESFYLAAFTPMDFKLKNGEVISLSVGEFMPISLFNPPIGKRFFMQKRFSKY